MAYFDDPWADPNQSPYPGLDPLEDQGMGGQQGPWTGGVTGSGQNPIGGGGQTNGPLDSYGTGWTSGQPAPPGYQVKWNNAGIQYLEPLAGGGGQGGGGQTGGRTYNPMAGWDTGKLNGDGNTLKYQFGRWVQDRGFDPVWARQNLGSVVSQWNQFSGGNARALGDDRIEFGQSYGPVDVLKGDNSWQWGAWSDPNAAPGNGGTNSLSSLMGGQSGTPTTAPTWTAVQQNSSAYGQSPLATARRRTPSTLAQLLGGQ